MTGASDIRDLPRLPVGDTGMEISRVGLGSWGLGEPLQAIRYGGEQPEERTVATVLSAVDAGINWIDTAPVYGLGTSEKRLAQALVQLPEAERPFVFTKCGISMRSEDRGTWFGTPERIREDVEASLARLEVERLDLVVMHQQPVDGTPVEVYWETLVELRNEGKVREVGLSNHSAEMLDRAAAITPVPLLQTAFSAINRLDGADVLPWCHEHGTAVVLWELCTAGCSAAPSMSAASAGWPTTTGGAPTRSSRNALLPTCWWSTPCARSQYVMASRSLPPRLRGRSVGPGSPAPSPAPGAPSMWRD